ncbi:vesicle-associated protein 2-2-like [Coffea eugenioides]|uniref:vesicle-associated protein 2-2-like n=1 Tax=Coffea eugenioides TaxID=49369 RepID=UPI000F6129C8|nr:vesicle-associated protein 2-2-like [Coffea eugenioides]
MEMSNELLDIQPRELKFIVELKKQSSCSVRLFNKSNHYVAFKVKTTSPKKYCVRPNTGVIEPKSACDFLVTMQAQKVALPDMTCKDKFLVQGTVVAEGTTEDDITSSLFAKENGKYVEESKLRVVLASPPHSPVLLPINGVHDQVPVFETSPSKDQVLRGDENVGTQLKVIENMMEQKSENIEPPVTVEARDLERVKGVEELELAKDVENLTFKISELELKLEEAQVTISKLTEERRLTARESESLRQELALLSTKKGVRRIQVGFPFLFVCMVSLVSVVLGYLVRCQ